LLLERFIGEWVTGLIPFNPLDYVLEPEKYKQHAEKRTFSRTSSSDGWHPRFKVFTAPDEHLELCVMMAFVPLLP
jgi:hypothetical protein